MNAVLKLAIPVLVALAFGPSQVLATPVLGADLKTFALLGATAVTNVPTSTIFGNVGTSPGSSITGFGPTAVGTPTVDSTGQVTGGLLHAATTQAAQAQLDLDLAILTLNNQLLFPTTLSIGPDLTGLTLAPGNYDVGAGILSGALILDGGSNPNAVWVFRFSSSFTTEEGSSVTVVDVGSGANVGVYWNVFSLATLDGNEFLGNVLAGTSITSNGALKNDCGRLLAATGNVTLSGDTVSIGCAGFAGTGGFDQGPEAGPSGVPEPGTIALFGVALAGLFVARKKVLASA